MLMPDWQDGHFSSYVRLFLQPEAAWVFFPLLAYSSVTMLCLLLDPQRYAESFFVRMGIYTAVLLSLQYSILTLLILEFQWEGSGQVLLLWSVPLIIFGLYWAAVKKWNHKNVNLTVALLVVAAFLWIIFSTGAWPLDASAFLLPLALLVPCTPVWCLLIAGYTSSRLLKHYETRLSLKRGAAIATWLLGFATAWRIGVLRTLELYAALPTRPPPDCYIATAAAQGHARFVGSRAIRLPDGQLMFVNAQLQRLKCAELSLMAVYPAAHRRLRVIYNVLGKRLARGILNPFLADIAYLSLKPFEWLAISALRVLVPEIDAASKTLYSPKGK